MADAQQSLAVFQQQVTTATDNASNATETNAQKLQDLRQNATTAKQELQGLKDALDALTGKAMTADQAEIAITQAVQSATTATKGQTGALVDVNGQIDLHSAKGAAAAQALMSLATAQHQEIAVMEQQKATTGDVNAKTDQLRQQFIQTAEQMDFTAQQAQNLANRYFGIPGQISTTVSLFTANLAYTENSINYVARDRAVQIYGVYHGTVGSMGMNAAGGKVSDTPITRIAFGGGGKVVGPGGPTDDLVRVLGPRSDVDYRLSNDETIIKSSSSRKYGPEKMAAVNAGTAVVSLPSAQPASRLANMSGSDATGNSGGGMTVQNLTLSLPNVTTIADPSLPRALVVAMRDELVKLERESR